MFQIGSPYNSIAIHQNDYSQYEIQGGYHGRVLAHELGHVFGLYHTFEIGFGKERIARVDSRQRGDLIHDTHADPGGLHYQDSSCSLNDAQMQDWYDPDSIRYIDAGSLRPDSTNYLTYPPIRCLGHFTAEQAMVMRCTVSNW